MRTSLAEGLAVRHEDGPCSVEYSLYTFKFTKGLSGLCDEVYITVAPFESLHIFAQKNTCLKARCDLVLSLLAWGLGLLWGIFGLGLIRFGGDKV